VHDRLAAKPADHLFETPSSQVLVQARLHADIQRQATNVHSRHVENHENLVKVSQAVSPLILEARLHAGIAKGLDLHGENGSVISCFAYGSWILFRCVQARKI
jgi:transcriptional regulator of aromatic amino acid metabolism